jgi:hypothetical protein
MLKVAKSSPYFDIHLEIDSEDRLIKETLRHKISFQFSHPELSIYM